MPLRFITIFAYAVASSSSFSLQHISSSSFARNTLHGINAVTGLQATSTSSESTTTLTENITRLKRILSTEYTSFFNPMYTEWYAPDVTFDDPLTSLQGVSKYQGNVDMLAGRTLMGKILFEDAGIVLHSVTGGEIGDAGIEDIITRWTLRVTAKVLPWSPTAYFTGISVYKVVPSTSAEGVEIVSQIDYWDSINISEDGSGNYGKVSKGKAVSDFLNQLKPEGFIAPQSAPELPYQLLRRGNGYEVREYPEHVVAMLPYKRRDEGFGSLGAFTRGMNPLAPALMTVPDSPSSNKRMSWPIAFTKPGESQPKIPDEAMEKSGSGQWKAIQIQTVPSKVVAVRNFNDVAMGPIVRREDEALRQALKRDGLVPKKGSEEEVSFAQYDAIFSMGKRRVEVWIELEEGGHPW